MTFWWTRFWGAGFVYRAIEGDAGKLDTALELDKRVFCTGVDSLWRNIEQGVGFSAMNNGGEDINGVK